MEILSNKVKMRDKNTQFVNNECVNNSPQIINSITFPSKNNETLVSSRQNNNVGKDSGNSGDINNNNNNNNKKLFLPHNSLKVFHQTYWDLNIKLINCLVQYILISRILSA